MKRLILLGVVLCQLLTSCVEKPALSSEQEYNHAAEITSAETEGIKASSDSETEPAKTHKELHPELHTLSYTSGDYIETENAIYYNDRFRNRIYFQPITEVISSPCAVKPIAVIQPKTAMPMGTVSCILKTIYIRPGLMMKRMILRW